MPKILLAFIIGLLALFYFFCPYAKADVPREMKPVYTIANNYATTAVNTGAFAQLDSSMDATCYALEIANSGANPLYLAIGASSAEEALPYTIPGASGLNFVPLVVKKGQRLTGRALVANNTSGVLIINCLQ